MTRVKTKRELILLLKAVLVERFFDLWDREIMEDLEKGRLDPLLEEARKEFENVTAQTNEEFLEELSRIASTHPERGKRKVQSAGKKSLSPVSPL